MKHTIRLLALGACALCGLTPGISHAGVGWSVGVRVGGPVYYRPWGCYPWGYYGYYRPYPIVLAAPSVIVTFTE